MLCLIFTVLYCLSYYTVGFKVDNKNSQTLKHLVYAWKLFRGFSAYNGVSLYKVNLFGGVIGK